ncbi:MAG TPA: cation diffusion facilitator family transporter [Candidatus Baltobacteraceae bacterium]
MKSRLVLALALTAAVAAFEFWGGLRSGSLALLTDAVHVCMDVFALGLAFATLVGAQRPANRHKTFGYGRLEVLGALANGTLLFAATIVIVYEAVHRLLFVPSVPHGTLMSAVALVGLVVNAGVGMLLLRDRAHNLNVRAALYHIAGDVLGGFAVLVGGIVIFATNVRWVDPLLSLFVAAIIVVGIVRILRDATDVLLEGAPRGIDTTEVRERLSELAGVVEVHDLHVWTIGTAARALSAHVLLDDRRISEATAVLREIEDAARRRYGITHLTVQFECESCEPDGRVICTQRLDSAEALPHRH